MAVTPMHDRIVVKPLEPVKTTAAGIVLPENKQESHVKATVVKTGPGRRLENGVVLEVAVKENDVVLYGKSTGQPIKLGSEDFVVLKEEDIIAVVEE